MEKPNAASAINASPPYNTGRGPNLSTTKPDAICTAQDIGSYKPDPRNFRYLIDTLAKLGFGRQQILHTAQSLYHDHAPAKASGLACAWIDRRHERQGWGATLPPAGTPAYDFRFESLADMVAGHQRELQG